jgi:hypothetical protein
MSSSRITTRRSRPRRSQRASFSSSMGRIRTLNTILRIEGALTCSSTAVTSTAIAPAISGSNDWASFAALYDEFKVNSIDVVFNFGPIVASTDSAFQSGIATAIDPNESAAVTYANLSDYQTFVLHPITAYRPQVRRSWPCRACYNLSNHMLDQPWQQCSQQANFRYTTLLIASNLQLSSTVAYSVPYVLTYHVSFRMRT